MPFTSEKEAIRRRRERIIILALVIVVALLTFIETKVIRFGANIPISNTILMFILININTLLLLLLIFLVFRNIVKLLYDRKRKVIGARLRTKLVVTFITLSLVPTILLFFFSIQFITANIEFWFNIPVEKALQNSLQVGRTVYKHIDETNRFFLERIAYQIVRRKLLEERNQKSLRHYLHVTQRAFNIHGIEIYSHRLVRLSFAFAPDQDGSYFKALATDKLIDTFQKGVTRTITELVPSGELVRTIGPIPFSARPGKVMGAVVVTNIIPRTLSQNLASIARGYEEYQQIKMIKRPIQISNFITLSIVALLIIFCATWFGFYLAKTITTPLQELAEGTQRIAEGDLNFKIDMVADREMGMLVDAFNKMTRDLRKGKEQLELSAKELRERNLEIEQKSLYMETVLKNISAGVVSLDANGFITTVNKSAERLLSLIPDQILHRNYRKVLRPEHLSIAESIMEELNKTPGHSVERTLRLTINQRSRTFLVHVTALKDETDNYMGVVVVFDDLTQLEKAQRMVAWREVARRIAHEVKNPLTPIKLSAQRLQRKYGNLTESDGRVFNECIQTIIDQVDQIGALVNEFSEFARFPAANPKPNDLVAIIEETLALYKEGHPHITFETYVDRDTPLINLDKEQMKRVMINLIDNAIAAIRGKGTITISLTFDPILKMARLEVADTGSGITPEDKVRLFEPYFSTKKSGMGLGLSIVSNIISDHNGYIRVLDNQPCGTKFIIELPA